MYKVGDYIIVVAPKSPVYGTPLLGNWIGQIGMVDLIDNSIFPLRVKFENAKFGLIYLSLEEVQPFINIEYDVVDREL